MKNLKKLGASLLALVMALGMVAPAMAAQGDGSNPSGSEPAAPPAPATVTLTLPKGPAVAGRTYNVYQIFTGKPASTTDLSMTEIAWGASVSDNGAAIIAALKALQADGIEQSDGTVKKLSKEYFTDTTLPAGATAEDVAKALHPADGTAADEKLIAQALRKAMPAAVYETLVGAEDKDQSVTMPTGYYLVDEPTDIEALNLIQLTENRDITVKSSKVPTMYKKVWNGTAWVDLADYEIGDEVNFRLAATLPTGYSLMNEYGLTFHDEMQNSLTFNADSVTVKYYTPNELDSQGNPTGNGHDVATADYRLVQNPTDNCTFEVVINNTKTGGSDLGSLADGSVIVVEYKATLNGNAVLGNPGNLNTAWVTDDKGNETPKDPVGVFTFSFDITKTDTEGNGLNGAEFTLEKKNGDTWEPIDEFTAAELVDKADGTGKENGSVFKLDNLSAGDYRLTETKAPEGYHGLTVPIEFTISYEPGTDGSGNPILKAITIVTNSEEHKLTGDVTDGSISGSITNYTGIQLPETGGIGTTIFYILGGALAVGAVVLLITKRRVGSSDDE